MIDLRGSPSCRESPLRVNEMFGLRARTAPTGSRHIGRHSRYHVEGTSQVELELGGSPRPDSPTRSGGTPTLWRVERNTCWREAPCIPSAPRGKVALAKTATPVTGSQGKTCHPVSKLSARPNIRARVRVPSRPSRGHRGSEFKVGPSNVIAERFKCEVTYATSRTSFVVQSPPQLKVASEGLL